MISACASYFGFALTLAAGTLCLVNLRSVSYVRDAGYMEENFPGKDGTAGLPVADPFPPVAEIPVAAGSDQIGAPGYIEISKILSEAENTENESVSDKISEEILENDADTDNETVEELPVTVPEDEPAPAQGAADEDSESDATENDASDETAEVEEEQTLHDDIENEIENENASETPDDTPDPQEDGAATEEVPPQKNDAAVYHERIFKFYDQRHIRRPNECVRQIWLENKKYRKSPMLDLRYFLLSVYVPMFRSMPFTA